MMNGQIRLGITGGIGSGKSVVSRLLRTMDIPVYDADSRAKALQEESDEIRTKLKALLGDDIDMADGHLDRKRMAAIIFNDEEMLQRVNAIIHPVVFEDFAYWAESQDSLIVAMESAILIESGLQRIFVDRICAVSAPLELRIRRAMMRDDATREQIERRVANQMADEEREILSDYIVVNDGRRSLIVQVRAMLARLAQELIDSMQHQQNV